MKINRDSSVFRYGLAVGIAALLMLISYGRMQLGFRFSMTFLITAGVVMTAWWGGFFPGLLITVAMLVYSLFWSPPPPDTTLARHVFTHVSAFSPYFLLIILVSARRKTEARLRSQRGLLRNTLENLGQAVITIDPGGKITFLNAQATFILSGGRDLTGFALADVVTFVDDSDGKPAGDLLELGRNIHDSVTYSHNSLIVRDSGRRIPVSLSIIPVAGEKGGKEGMVIVFEDDTPRREAAEALKNAERRQEQSQRMEAIGTLTGGVAHDFNNLLTAILGYTELAMAKLKGSPAYENLVNVEKAGRRAAELTRKLLTFSRRQSLDIRVIDLNDSIDEMLKLLERLIGVKIQVVLKKSPRPLSVNADPSQIEQVIMNLCINARDAMPNGGRLVIESRAASLDEHYCRQYQTCEPGEFAELLVSDTGHGMDQATLDRIFEPFFTTKEVDKGTGLGLSTVYGIVKQHGGHINVYSEVDRGTTFKVYLPIAATPASAKESVPVPPVVGGTERILVADDEESLRNLSRDVLEALGYTVITAENGEKAVKIFEDHRDSINLLLLDIVMPIKGGIEAYRQITADGTKVPVIFMTGYSSEILDNSKAKMLHTDTLPVIQKPYTLDALGRMVRATLDGEV